MKKRLKLKESVQGWLLIHAFGLILYLAIFSLLFGSKELGSIFACGVMTIAIIGEILIKISKNLLTSLAK